MAEKISRRNFISQTVPAGVGLSFLCSCLTPKVSKPGSGMQLGLVTYLWGKDWDLPTLIANCSASGLLGVELRTQHAHGVEPNLNAQQRAEVKKRFKDSPVTCLGYGSNQEYHANDPEKLRQNIEGTYDLIKLCHDIGASGVKVKPNNIPDGVSPEKTLEQIGRALNTVGKYARDYDQEIRVEVHGRRTSELPNMKKIFDYVEEPNVSMCWNCNEQDLLPPGLEANFNSVKDRFGTTVHVRELNVGEYPYQQMFNLFVKMDYNGWILLEARTSPENRVAAMKEQLSVFDEMIANAQSA